MNKQEILRMLRKGEHIQNVTTPPLIHRAIGSSLGASLGGAPEPSGPPGGPSLEHDANLASAISVVKKIKEVRAESGEAISQVYAKQVKQDSVNAKKSGAKVKLQPTEAQMANLKRAHATKKFYAELKLNPNGVYKVALLKVLKDINDANVRYLKRYHAWESQGKVGKMPMRKSITPKSIMLEKLLLNVSSDELIGDLEAMGVDESGLDIYGLSEAGVQRATRIRQINAEADQGPKVRKPKTFKFTKKLLKIMDDAYKAAIAEGLDEDSAIDRVTEALEKAETPKQKEARLLNAQDQELRAKAAKGVAEITALMKTLYPEPLKAQDVAEVPKRQAPSLPKSKPPPIPELRVPPALPKSKPPPRP